MEPEERIGDAESYIAFILSGETWNHGPLQVAEDIKIALDGGGLPDDCLEWANRKGGKGTDPAAVDHLLDNVLMAAESMAALMRQIYVTKEPK